MRIRLHNSLAKVHAREEYLFDEKFSISLIDNQLHLAYRIDDRLYFYLFLLEKKEFIKGSGFGLNEKSISPNWFKHPGWKWKEMSD